MVWDEKNNWPIPSRLGQASMVYIQHKTYFQEKLNGFAKFHSFCTVSHRCCMVFVCFAPFRPSGWTFFVCVIPFCLRYAFLFAMFYFLYEMIFFFALRFLIRWCLAFTLPFLFYFSLCFLICWCFGLFFAFSVFVLALLGNRRRWSLVNQIVTISHWYHNF